MAEAAGGGASSAGWKWLWTWRWLMPLALLPLGSGPQPGNGCCGGCWMVAATGPASPQQPGVWQGPDTRPPASLALGGRTYCCGPRRGQCPRSRPHSQCLRYLHCCPLGMCPERRRACPGLVLKALYCGQKGCSTQEEDKSGEWHGGCLLLAPKWSKTFGKQRLIE